MAGSYQPNWDHTASRDATSKKIAGYFSPPSPLFSLGHGQMLCFAQDVGQSLNMPARLDPRGDYGTEMLELCLCSGLSYRRHPEYLRTATLGLPPNSIQASIQLYASFTQKKKCICLQK